MMMMKTDPLKVKRMVGKRGASHSDDDDEDE